MNLFRISIRNPYFLIKRGLLLRIRANAHFLSGRLLDFGCGSKPYKQEFQHCSEYIGIDYENPGHDHSNEQIDVFYDGKNIPFPSDSFDSVFSSEVLEHVFDVHYTLNEIARVLKPGGRLLLTCPFVWPIHEEPFDFGRYTPFALRHLLQKSGFTIIHFEKVGNSKQTLRQLKIIHRLKYSWLFRFPLFNHSILNNGQFSLRHFLMGCVAICGNVGSGNGFFTGEKETNVLYLSNLVVAEKKK